MKKLTAMIELISGTPQFRITETTDEEAPLYQIYGQMELEADIVGLDSNRSEVKQVRTWDQLVTAKSGELVLSLISGQVVCVQPRHAGFLLTQNYVKLQPIVSIDSNYLLYLFNEDPHILRQLQQGLQGSTILRYSLRQIKDLILPSLPDTQQQKAIGDVYVSQLRLAALKRRVATSETKIILKKLRELNTNE
ncbi:restriction endonuclease subunit M [Lapidilactobacillus luobeiensis]|uniref:restriction endonuclease subunit M n=1 Tax=Lapidilactobacillus luobeiensis TaxID=2950371 RepID=UPI0021C26032|nr:restriction endonuclease subunit M [Lapidilactobacillus luobeiensis]